MKRKLLAVVLVCAAPSLTGCAALEIGPRASLVLPLDQSAVGRVSPHPGGDSHPADARHDRDLPEGFPHNIPTLTGDIPDSAVGTLANRATDDGRWYTTKANPFFGKMDQAKAEAKATAQAVKLLTDAGFVSASASHKNLYTNRTYYVDIRAVSNVVTYEVGSYAPRGNKEPNHAKSR